MYIQDDWGFTRGNYSNLFYYLRIIFLTRCFDHPVRPRISVRLFFRVHKYIYIYHTDPNGTYQFNPYMTRMHIYNTKHGIID